MLYWDCVLQEVLNKHAPEQQYFPYTNIQEHISEPISNDPPTKVKPIKLYLLDQRYPGVYFTRRESQCLILLTTGHTIKETGHALNLSARTVEFYLNNIKVKLKCRTKAELLQKIQDSDFLERAREYHVLKGSDNQASTLTMETKTEHT